MSNSNLLDPITPGEILLEEFLKPLGISQNKLARDIDVPPGRINEIIKGNRAITTETALRLSLYFNTSAEFWLNLQNHYDLEIARRTRLDELATQIRVFNPEMTRKRA